MVWETWLSPAKWLLPPSIQTLPLAQVLSAVCRSFGSTEPSWFALHSPQQPQTKQDGCLQQRHFNLGLYRKGFAAPDSLIPPSATCCRLARNVTDNHNRCHSHYHDFRSVRGVVLAYRMFLIVYRLGHPQTFILSFQLFMTLSANAALIDGTEQKQISHVLNDPNCSS